MGPQRTKKEKTPSTAAAFLEELERSRRTGTTPDFTASTYAALSRPGLVTALTTAESQLEHYKEAHATLLEKYNTLLATAKRQDATIIKLRTQRNELQTAAAATIAAEPTPVTAVTASTQTITPPPAPVSPPAATAVITPTGVTYSSIVAATPTRRPKVPISDRKRLATARAFEAPKPTSSPSGFEYVYISRNRNITRKDIRHRLSILGVTTSRIIDISFPANSVVGLLVHQDYKSDFLAVLDKCKVSAIDKFDRTAPEHLLDPKFKNLSDSQRTTIAAMTHQDRCLRTLHFIRPYLVPSVAKFFVDRNWVPSDLASGVIQSRAPTSRSYDSSSKRKLPSTYSSAAASFLQALGLSSSSPPTEAMDST